MEEIISVEKLCVRFVVRKRGKHLFSPREKSSVEALGGVSFGVKPGEQLPVSGRFGQQPAWLKARGRFNQPYFPGNT